MAYIDSGTGTLVLQGLLALIGGLVVYVQHPIQTMRSLWTRLRKKGGRIRSRCIARCGTEVPQRGMLTAQLLQCARCRHQLTSGRLPKVFPCVKATHSMLSGF